MAGKSTAPPPWLMNFVIVVVVVIWAAATAAELWFGKEVPAGISPVMLAVVGFLIAGRQSGKNDRTERQSDE